MLKSVRVLQKGRHKRFSPKIEITTRCFATKIGITTRSFGNFRKSSPSFGDPKGGEIPRVVSEKILITAQKHETSDAQ